MPRISIIVPIFNVEDYLYKCIESLRAQTLKDIEIILVNDGSTDSSLAICRSFVDKDKRIKLINKVNGGVSSARNAGLDIARGQYVGFVDPDDWIEPDMFNNMYHTISMTNTDICICNYFIEYPQRSIATLLPFKQDILDRADIVNGLIANMLSGQTLDSGELLIMGSVWRLLIRNDFVHKHKLRFPLEVPLMEDLVFVVNALLNARSVSIDNGLYYHYVIRRGSAVNRYRRNLYECEMKVFNLLNEALDRHGVYNDLKDRMDYRYVNLCLNVIANEARSTDNLCCRHVVEFINHRCVDTKLKDILSRLEVKGYTFKKRLVLTALKREWGIFLYLYYSGLNWLRGRAFSK